MKKENLKNLDINYIIDILKREDFLESDLELIENDRENILKDSEDNYYILSINFQIENEINFLLEDLFNLDELLDRNINDSISYSIDEFDSIINEYEEDKDYNYLISKS